NKLKQDDDSKISHPALGTRGNLTISPQLLELGLQSRDALVPLGDGSRNVSGLEPLRDVLLTIRVPGRHGEENDLFRARAVAGGDQACDQFAVSLDDARLSPKLDPLPRCVIDEKQMGLGIVGEIALGDVLPIS